DEALALLDGVPGAKTRQSEGARLRRLALHRQGEAAWQRGDLGAAAAALKDADAADSTPWTHHDRAVVLAAQGKWKPAVKAWRAVQKAVPEATFNLAVALERSGDHEGAWQLYDRHARAGRPHSDEARRIADAKARVFGFGQGDR
ncbi:MAG: tetratricopeptide repeat protein, partial [Myxococcales bacterium]|nr:tetratricopeptide repeat protein [Myxococcales bacterium]